jgi:hypothetical protein
VAALEANRLETTSQRPTRQHLHTASPDGTDERLDDRGRTKLCGLSAVGDPKGEVKTTWHAKEVIRSIYEIDTPELADEFVSRLASDLQDRTFPLEVRSLGGPSIAGRTTSWHGIGSGPPTAPPWPSTTSSRGSSGSPLRFDDFAHSGSGRCSTPADPTGTYWPPLLPAEIRSALNPERFRAGVHTRRRQAPPFSVSRPPPSRRPTRVRGTQDFREPASRRYPWLRSARLPRTGPDRCCGRSPDDGRRG